MKARQIQHVGLWFAALLAVATMGACGGDDSNDSTSSAKDGNATEAAFLQAMIPHHESAVEMADMAGEKAKHPQIKQLAQKIVAAQNREITQMRSVYRRLFGKAIKPDAGAHTKLGLSAEDAGMAHMDMSELENATPFDRSFIDEMVGHHQGAIRMARAVSAQTDDSEMKELSASIIQAQSSEISEMNAWRKRWYGAASPSGGVPTVQDGRETEEDSEHEMEGH